MPILQKACLSYLGTENLSRKERQQVIDAWGDWVDFQFKLTPHHELIEQSLRYYHSIVQDIESLQNPETPEALPQQQETGQEGGL